MYSQPRPSPIVAHRKYLSLRAQSVLHDLEDETSFVGLAGQQRHGGGHVPGVDADHVWVLVIPEVAQLLGLLGPGVPDDRVWQVVLLYPHLPAWHHIGHDVLMGQWGVDVNPKNIANVL